MAETIAVRPFVDEDLPAVLEVLRISLGEPPGLTRTEQLFAWKHFNNPFGRSLLLVAEEGGRLAGIRAFMRWDLAGPDGGYLRCVRAVDTATHPDFQRRGVFRQLTLAGLDLAASSGIDLVFNTPNEKSGAGYLTMGWNEVGPVGVMVRPGAGLLRPNEGAWEPGGSAPTSESLAAAGEWFHRPPRGWRTPRTPEYLRWRFASHPTACYLISGVADGVAIGRANRRQGRRELVLSELGGSPAAIRTLRRAAGPDYTVGWFSAGTPERSAAFRGGLLPVPRKAALTVMARPLRHLDVDLGWQNWDLSLGDIELL